MRARNEHYSGREGSPNCASATCTCSALIALSCALSPPTPLPRAPSGVTRDPYSHTRAPPPLLTANLTIPPAVTMASYTERVVRSLSADELDADARRDADALFRHTAAHVAYPEASAAPAKERRGLFKRLRAALRGGGSGTAASRPGRVAKDIRPVVDILPEDHLASANLSHHRYAAFPAAPFSSQLPHHQQQLQQQLAESRRAPTPQHSQPMATHRFDPPSDPRLANRFPAVAAPFPDERDSPRRQPLPKAKTATLHHSGRARSWRPSMRGDSARSFISERSNNSLHDSDAAKQQRPTPPDSKRGRIGGSATGSRFADSGPRSSPGVFVSQGNATQGQEPPPASQGTRRSLPKRVFSSPPSLSARSFVFGSRRKGTPTKNGNRRVNSVLGQNGQEQQQQQQLSGPLSSASKDMSSLGKKSGSFGGGQPSYLKGGSMNLSVGPGGLNMNKRIISPEHSAVAFKAVAEGAVEGKVSFSSLLDAMYRLEERLPTQTKDVLMKYFSRQDNIEALIDRLTVILPILSDDDGVEGPSGQRVRYRHSYVSSSLLSSGPITLRHCLFSNAQHLDRLVAILKVGYPSDPALVRAVCKVLLSMLRDSPKDTVAAMSRRRDFLQVLLSHIAVTGCPEVCLSMLSTVRCQQELKFGDPNVPVVCMMADAKLLPTLCDKLAAAAEDGALTSVASSTIENCSRVIVGIALRALVIKRFEINDVDDSDTKFMTKFNNDLESLDVFINPFPILRVLDSGFAAMSKHDKRGYALATALTSVRYMLVTVINGQDSSLSTIRLQLDTLNTGAYEAGVRARIPMLAKVLESARAGVTVDTMWDSVDGPLGVVRLKILDLLVVLLQHGSEKTTNAMVDADIPRTLVALFKRLEMNSLLQHIVSTIVDLAFRQTTCARFRRSLLLDARLLEVCKSLWDVNTSRRRVQGSTASNRGSDIVRMCRAADDFLRDRALAEVQALVVELAARGDDVDEFARFCEIHIGPAHSRLNAQLVGGSDNVPRRLDDGVASFDGLGFGAVASAGAAQMYTRSRAGSAAVAGSS